MKTFTSGLKARSSALRDTRAPRRSLPAGSSRVIVKSPHSDSSPFLSALTRCLQSIARFICVERNGAMVCCIPGAPIVRLPSR